ncbi:MAG TPA: HAD-IA family hydrolase [Thermoanaerobaculia bacterium]|nr:HAD-IA family hydrolase [Thermoanaerobaculia bacterium]
MTRRYDLVTFDCYGTLIDWEDGIASAFVREAAEDGVVLDRARILAAYHELEPEIEATEYRAYRDVLAATAMRVAQRLGWPLTGERTRFLPDSLPGWKPFPDTNPALERLAAAGHRLGILSNVDDDLLGETRRHFPVAFDIVVTAQQVGSYKPAHGHFLEALRRIGSDRWLHAAQSFFHDVVPARELGIAVAWINRKAERPTGDVAADVELRNLTELAELLG